MGISNVNANSLADQLLASMKKKEKNAAQEGDDFAALLSGGAISGSANNKTSKPAEDLTASRKPDAVQEFLDYMKKTPEERMQEAWLRQHGISEADWEAMSPEEKQAITDQMKKEIQDKLQQEAEKSDDGEAPKIMIGLGLGLG